MVPTGKNFDNLLYWKNSDIFSVYNHPKITKEHFGIVLDGFFYGIQIYITRVVSVNQSLMWQNYFGHSGFRLQIILKWKRNNIICILGLNLHFNSSQNMSIIKILKINRQRLYHIAKNKFPAFAVGNPNGICCRILFMPDTNIRGKNHLISCIVAIVF